MGIFDFYKSIKQAASSSVNAVSDVLTEVEQTMAKNKRNNEMFSDWRKNFLEEKTAWRLFVQWAGLYSTNRMHEQNGTFDEYLMDIKEAQELLPDPEFWKGSSILSDRPNIQVKKLFEEEKYSLEKCSESIALNCPSISDSAVKEKYAQLMLDRQRTFFAIKQDLITKLQKGEIITEALAIVKAKFYFERKLYLWHELRVDHLVDSEKFQNILNRLTHK